MQTVNAHLNRIAILAGESRCPKEIVCALAVACRYLAGDAQQLQPVRLLQLNSQTDVAWHGQARPGFSTSTSLASLGLVSRGFSNTSRCRDHSWTPPESCYSRRWMSTGGISRKDFLWGINDRLKPSQTSPSSTAQEETLKEPDFFAQLEREGYHSIQEALQRVVIGAYQLLQEDRVDQAESMVAEAVKAAESILGQKDPSLAQVRDQLALLQFMQGNFVEAERTAAMSLEAALQMPASEDQRLAVAMCQLRLGAIIQGLSRHAEAEDMLLSCIQTLELHSGETMQPLSEAQIYYVLSRLTEPSVSDIETLEAVLLQAFANLASVDILGLHLLRAALREHRVLMGAAVEAENWGLAEAIIKQEVKLQEAVLPQSPEMALSLYQYATLQYTRGLLQEGEQLCCASLDLCRHLHRKDSSSHVALRIHRLGTVRLAQGRSQEALQLLSDSCKSLTTTAGEVNPLTGEARAALALARVDHLDATHRSAGYFVRFGYPHERAAIMGEAAQGLADMRKGFGDSHLLVLKMQEIYDRLWEADVASSVVRARRR